MTDLVPETCANCGATIATPARMCPNCGASRTARGSWPPRPSGPYIPEPKTPLLLTVSELGDITFGAVGALVPALLIAAYGLGIVLLFILSAATRKYRYVERGTMFGCGSMILVALGAFAFCIYSVYFSRT